MRSFSTQSIYQKIVNKYISRGSFVYNAATILAGNVSAQLVALALSPLVTRLYLPEHFGMMLFITSIINVIASNSCLRYETAVVLPKEDGKSYNLMAVCIIISIIISLAILVSAPIFGDIAESYSDFSGIKLYLFLVPIGVLANGLEITFRYWYTRKKKFSIIAKTRFFNPLFTSGIIIVFGLIIGSSAIGLIIGHILGPLLIGMIFLVVFLRSDYHLFKSFVSKKNIWAAASEYSKFPKYNSVTALMNALSQNLPALLFASFFSLEFVGLYALANKVLKRPVQMISNSIGGVFLQRTSELSNKGKSIRSNFLKSTLSLALIGIVPVLVICIGGGSLFSFIFGEKWYGAGFYSALLSPFLFCVFINTPATQILLVKEKLFFYLVFQIFLLSFRAIAIVAGHYISSDPWVAVALFSSVGVVANIILITYAYMLVNKS